METETLLNNAIKSLVETAQDENIDAMIKYAIDKRSKEKCNIVLHIKQPLKTSTDEQYAHYTKFILRLYKHFPFKHDWSPNKKNIFKNFYGKDIDFCMFNYSIHEIFDDLLEYFHDNDSCIGDIESILKEKNGVDKIMNHIDECDQNLFSNEIFYNSGRCYFNFGFSRPQSKQIITFIKKYKDENYEQYFEINEIQLYGIVTIISLESCYKYKIENILNDTSTIFSDKGVFRSYIVY